MKLRRIAKAVLMVLGISGCGSPPPPPKRVEAASEPKVADDLPTWCSGGKDPCVPTREFATSLCHGQFRGAALFLFQKNSPWERRWVKSKQGLSANNGEGGPAGEALGYGEELLVMAVDVPAPAAAEPTPKKKGKAAEQPDPNILALRWDGTCVSLKGSEVASLSPKTPTQPPVRWSKLDPFVQRSLLREAAIVRQVEAHDKACAKGKSPSECEMTEEMLSNSIVAHVRRGTKLSMPEERP